MATGLRLVVLHTICVLLAVNQSLAQGCFDPSSDASTFCQSNPGVGYYYFCDSCQDYIWCVNGAAYPQSCPGELEWHVEVTACLPGRSDSCTASQESMCGTLPDVENGAFVDKKDGTAKLKCDLGYNGPSELQDPILCEDAEGVQDSASSPLCKNGCVNREDISQGIKECPTGVIKKYQLCDSCTEFLLCNYGTDYIQQCSTGTFFDSHGAFCTYPSSTCSECGPLPSVTNGNFQLFEKDNQRNPRLAVLICEAGFQPRIPNLEIVCEPGSTDWGMEEQELCISNSDLECQPVPEVENGGFELLEEENLTARLRCNDGFEPLSGYRNFIINCLDNQWPTLSSYDLCEEGCINNCIGKENRNYEYCADCAKYISCNGDIAQIMPCNMGLFWDDDQMMCVGVSTTCGVDPCGEQQNVANGRFVPEPTNPRSATLECDDGYVAAINGFKISCDGKDWTKPPPNICTTELASTARGTRFVVAFFTNFDGQSSLGISVTSSKNTMVIVWDTERLEFNNIELSITPAAPLTIAVPSNFQNTESFGVSQNVIFIEADDDLNVYAINGKGASSDATLILPVNVLGTEYMISAGPESLSITIVGIEDDTEVSIVLPTNEVITRSINQGDLFYTLKDGIFKSTGTQVLSDKPVAVFTGNKCTQVPLGVAACDALYEQLPPVTSLQFVYVTSCFRPRLAFRVEIVPVKDDTDVSIYHGTSLIELRKNKGQHITLDYFNCETIAIIGSKPILVSQFSLGSYSDNFTIANVQDTIGDPSLVFLPAITNYDNTYSFPSFNFLPSLDYAYQTALITILTADRAGLRINGGIITDSSDMAEIDVPIYGKYNVVYVTNTDAGVDTFTHVDNKPFGAIQYGATRFTEYALSLGSRLKTIDNQNEK